MKSIKRGLAVLLAVLLIIPALPTSAEILPADEKIEKDVTGVENKESAQKEEKLPEQTVSSGDILPEEKPSAGVSEPAETPEQEEAIVDGTLMPEDVKTDEVQFNTGRHVWSVVNREAFDAGLGDVFFEENGSYTINIPEDNPFFPYEVQFIYEGETKNEWFMTPDDSVEIGGHRFYVSAYFDNTAVTRMGLNVAGSVVTVWPEKKEFTDEEEGGISELSLLPLTEKYLTVDLRAFTPAELTMVSLDSIFTGNDTLQNTDKVAWAYNDAKENYTISDAGSILDLSRNTTSSSTSWQMIVGDANQLTPDNTRYIITANLTPSKEWLQPTIYMQDSAGNRRQVSALNYSYHDSDPDSMFFRELSINIPRSETKYGTPYVSLAINRSAFGSSQIDHFKVYEGRYNTAAEAAAGRDITAQICNTSMGQKDAGYTAQLQWGQLSEDITIVAFNKAGQVIGCLPVWLYLYMSESYINSSINMKTVSGWDYVCDTSSTSYVDGCVYETKTLYKGYAANNKYYLTMDYYKLGVDSSSGVTAAYVGQYASIAEATSKGAVNIKDVLFDKSIYSGGGYEADYSQGVYFTVFIGADGTVGQEVCRQCIKTEEGTREKASTLYNGTSVWFTGLNDSAGNLMDSYITSPEDDSYSENNYITILVDENTDLTKLAPIFNTSSGVVLYTAGNSAPEVSGISVHDFSKGPVQYTASSEDKENQRNYWLQIVKRVNGTGKLYINSLADRDAETNEKSGVIYSKREMMLDGFHDYKHDILLINSGTNVIPGLSVELASDTVQLDEYWTLNGAKELAGFTTLTKTQSNGELPNLAKVRLKVKDGVAEGTEISGTVTVKSAGTALIVLTLSGTVGDPCIVTDVIPEAVKYVPYGTMIQNNNKYSWNRVSYRLIGGSLPGGMRVEPNGEIYGVPTEQGEFTFSVEMQNSNYEFKSSVKDFTLSVLENTDANVDRATDTGYDLLQRVQDIYLNMLGSGELTEDSRTMVSQGVYGEFVDIYLDGEKLVSGTDYKSESGSTRITIYDQTFQTKGGSVGTHTLGVEFRNGTGEVKELKRAAQNYKVTSSGGSSGGGHGGTGGGNVVKQEPTVEQTEIGAVSTAITYVVQRGDTLWKIAKKFYGDGSHWQKIYADNISVISNPNKIYVGQVLTLYPLEGDGSILTGTDITGIEGGHYTVQRGDTLWKISGKAYGTGQHWKRIYEANRDKITKPEQIYVGQILVIPE